MKYILFMLMFLCTCIYAGDLKLNDNAMTVSSGGLAETFQYRMISGANVLFASTTTVTITDGYGMCKDRRWKVTSDVTDTVDIFDNGGFTYCYIDYSAIADGETLEASDIIWSATEPAQNATYGNAWMNGDDLCISGIYCNGAATIAQFTSCLDNGDLRILYTAWNVIASDMNPSYTWQTPDDSESSVYLPVNATEAYIYMAGDDSGAACQVLATNYNNAVGSNVAQEAQVYANGYIALRENRWVLLDSTRNIRITGSNDDDNTLDCAIRGYKIER